MKKTKVYVAIPSIGTISDAIPYTLRALEKDYGDKIEFVYPEICVQRKFHDFARNCMVEDFLKTDCDILWFLDSDIVPPPNVMDLVTKYGEHWELAGAPYPVFMTPDGYMTPQVVMCVYTQSEKGLHAAKVPFEGTCFVDGLATGCIFIKREVFEKLQKPYFEFKYDSETRLMTEGEDLGFCKKVNALGYKFFTDFSLTCKHYKTVDLMDVNAYAIQYANATVESHHKILKEQAYDACKAAYAEGFKRGKGASSKSGLILPR